MFRTFIRRYSFIAILSSIAARCIAMESPVPPLSLSDAVALATRDAPMLRATQAQVEAGREQRDAAGRLPDPVLQAAIANLPIEGDAALRFSKEPITQRRLGLMQRFPNPRARAADRELADARIVLAQARESLTRQQVRQAAADAWILRWAAERRADLLRQLAPLTQAIVEASEAAVSGGSRDSSDVLRARLGDAHLQQRIRDAEADAQAARADLHRWIGERADSPLAMAPDFGDIDLAALRHQLDRRAELAPLRAEADLAQAEIRRADASRKPGWSLGFAYGDRDPAFGDLISLEFQIDLPLFQTHRQLPEIRASRARERAALDQLEQTRRDLDADLEVAIVRWQAAREREHHYRHEHLPLADAAVKAALAAYSGGSGDLGGVLDAEREAIAQRLDAIAAETQLALSWQALAFLDPVASNSTLSPNGASTP